MNRSAYFTGVDILGAAEPTTSPSPNDQKVITATTLVAVLLLGGFGWYALKSK